jgi:hypothetical protein
MEMRVIGVIVADHQPVMAGAERVLCPGGAADSTQSAGEPGGIDRMTDIDFAASGSGRPRASTALARSQSSVKARSACAKSALRAYLLK